MRTIQGGRGATLAAVVVACTLVGGVAQAGTYTNRPGSLLMFPKVVTTGTRDTVLQITNTGNMPVDLRCFYLNGESCLQTDFHLSLTKQQPTFWDAGAGRRVSPTDNVPGLDPGLVPPLPKNFEGALVCVEVGPDDNPLIRNQVKGEATIVDNSGSSTINATSKYNAFAVQGLSMDNDHNTLDLDDVEYSGCPASLVLNFEREGSDSVVEALGNGGRCSVNSQGCNNNAQCVGTCTGAGGFCTNNTSVGCDNSTECNFGTCSSGESRVLTRVTVLPCNLDLDTLQPAQVALAFSGSDEEESNISGSGTFTCWASFTVPEPENGFSLSPPGTPFASIGIRSTSGGPVVAVAEGFHSDSVANTGSAMVDLHTLGLCSDGARSGKICTRDADCPSSSCVITSAATIKLPIP